MSSRVSDRWARLSSQIAMKKGDLEWVTGTLATEDDPKRREALSNRAARIKDEIRHLAGQQEIEGSVSKHADNYSKALGQLNGGLVSAALELTALRADQKKYPAEWFAEQQASAVAKVTALDGHAQKALEAYQTDAISDATRLRAAAEVGVDPSKRLADEMLRMRLMQSPTDANDLARKGRDLLYAGQPEQAKVYIDAARDKGARLTGEVLNALDDALDAAVPMRAEARAIEEEFFVMPDAAVQAAFRRAAEAVYGDGGFRLNPVRASE